ncbi:MAG TPA: nucleotide exchange factor GrpE [Ruminiclostridium sp.]|jgi:molecular chaperone GrpE|nr:nucleotide exchange factor GrpE [Clostridiaceae bacterium]HAA25615.1 nucleotide exchange factor GrpE [Ruminiclostridium sp.]
MDKRKTDEKQIEDVTCEVDNTKKNTGIDNGQTDGNEQQTLQPENGNSTDKKEEDIDKKAEELDELKDRFQRLAAEFDNYKKRTLKEKEKLYGCAVADIVAAFLPVLDNIERAVSAADEQGGQSIREGVQLIHRQILDILSNMGVKQIEALGKPFNPDFHEAVSHVEDEKYGENEVIEEFQKGYIYKDEIVIRHSMVKVAN